VLEVAGLQSFELPGEPVSRPRVTYITPALARASAILKAVLERFDLDLQTSRRKTRARAPEQNRPSAAGRLQFHMLGTGCRYDRHRVQGRERDDRRRLSPEASGTLALADLRGRVSQAASFEVLERGRGSVTDALEHWREKRRHARRGTADARTGPASRRTCKALVASTERIGMEGELTGAVDAGLALGAIAGALTGGQLKLEAADARIIQFRCASSNGDIEAGVALGLGGR
jgi:hypothetical protein